MKQDNYLDIPVIEYKVVLVTSPLPWQGSELIETIMPYKTLRDATRVARQCASMRDTVSVSVYGTTGELEYYYDRETNLFRPISELAKKIVEDEYTDILEVLRSRDSEN